MAVPNDTYAGASQILFVVVRLRQGERDLKFHAFNCVPGPRIIPTEAVAESNPASWSMYPGSLLRVEIHPDFGWLSFLIQPFVHEIYVWFDPRDHWNYGGALYNRYYKGPYILAVRVPQPSQHREN